MWTSCQEQAFKNLDVNGTIQAACLSFSLSVPTGRGKSLCYTILSYVQSSRDLKDWFFHLCFESNSAIKQDEASLVHIARRYTLSWDSFTASRAGKTNLYQTLHVHVHWMWQHEISIPFMGHKIIPNSANQNGIGRLPDFSSPFGRMKSLACETTTDSCLKWSLPSITEQRVCPHRLNLHGSQTQPFLLTWIAVGMVKNTKCT